MRKPVLITLDYPPEQGGVARFLGELVRAAGGDITIVVEKRHELTGPGIVVSRELVRTSWPHWWPMVGVCREFAASASYLIVSHVLPVGTAAMIAKWLGGAPFVVFCHGLDVRLAAGHWRRSFIFRLVCRNAKLVVANSEATATEIRRLVPNLRIVTLTPGVRRLSSVAREDARQRLGVAQDEEIVLAVARLIPRKGVDVLLDATERLPDREKLTVVVVGDGPERVKLEQMAEHLKHRVRFITKASDEDVGLWYAAADVFCLPLREHAGDMEGFGIVYLEAAVHGLPVIAGRSGGAAEAVEDEKTGILVKPNDSGEVAQALERVLHDPLLRERMGLAGRERAECDFRWEDRWNALQSVVGNV
ncbi:MAG TPA: glycosyltransferase family 4 protein [Candidatus Methylomirabilis sp.]|nr:glycosyltransferase family 4 protein [Candidatus Methylomirabilis sp.]